MKKIMAKHSDKDSIVCVSVSNGHKFYYQPAGSRERIWLLQTAFSGSVFGYFRKYGRKNGDCDFSLSIRELYCFCNYKNEKLHRILARIPAQVEYAIKNEMPAVGETFSYGAAQDCGVYEEYTA